MAKSKAKVEQGVFLRAISATGRDNPAVAAYSKATIFEQLEAEYPSAEGWKVRSSQYVEPVRSGNDVLGYMVIYFLEKVNE